MLMIFETRKKTRSLVTSLSKPKLTKHKITGKFLSDQLSVVQDPTMLCLLY